jgi:hypothetical protein
VQLVGHANAYGRFCSAWIARQPMFRAARTPTTFSAWPPSSALQAISLSRTVPGSGKKLPGRVTRHEEQHTPRVFIAATRQNDGKTTTSLGLLAACKNASAHRLHQTGRPALRRSRRAEDRRGHGADGQRLFKLNCPLVDMSPIAVEPDFTRKYLQTANNDALVKKIQNAFDRVAWEKDFVLCEGSGHAGVGSVFDLSNAQVAKHLEVQRSSSFPAAASANRSTRSR